MPKCYLAGPMTGYPADNIPAFYSAERALRNAGWDVINPAALDSQNSPYPLDFTNEEDRRLVILRDIRAIMENLTPSKGDAIVFLPYWQFSSGARSEWATGVDWFGLRELTLEEALKRRH